MAELTRHECGPDFTAKFDGECRLCHKPIEKGIDFVTTVDGQKGVVHSHCGRGYCRALDDNLPEDDVAGRTEIREAISQLREAGVPVEEICQDLEEEIVLLRRAA